ncbi:MAG: biotin transporter BioY [Clostridiaceae bacterium]|nr:biotin transporter BioY [Clostridiaceae bacterium]
MNQSTNKETFSTRSLVTMAMFAAILCVSAYISIPLPNGSHITALNFVMTIIALSFPLAQSFFIALLWILLGAVGIPVFIGGNAGIGYLFGNLGGFSFALLLTAILLPLLCRRKYNRIYFTGIAIASAIFVDLFGSIWYMLLSGTPLPASLLVCFLPFIPLDLLKAVAAAQIVPQFRLALSKA